MNKIQLTFGKENYIAKFGIGFIGEYLKNEDITIEEMFSEFQKNPFFTAPKLMYYSLKKGTPDFNLTLSEVEDLIDEDGSLQSPQLIAFINGFSESLKIYTESVENMGKPKKPIPKNR